MQVVNALEGLFSPASEQRTQSCCKGEPYPTLSRVLLSRQPHNRTLQSQKRSMRLEVICVVLLQVQLLIARGSEVVQHATANVNL